MVGLGPLSAAHEVFGNAEPKMPTKPTTHQKLTPDQSHPLLPLVSHLDGCCCLILDFMPSSSAGCAVRATLGFNYRYLNAWKTQLSLEYCSKKLIV